MSDTNAPEPTMEEILASIRRIISEDDAPAPADASTTASPGDPPPPPVATSTSQEPTPHGHADDVLELTDRLEPEPQVAFSDPQPPPAAEPPPVAVRPPPPTTSQTPPAAPSLGDLDFAPASRSAPPSASRPAAGGDEPLVGHGAAGRAADHFGALASSLSMPDQGRTLEDVVRELLRPMMKEWLDTHLPSIVETRVQDEVERISRRRTY